MDTPNDAPNADSGTPNEKPRKDFWDKADIIIKALNILSNTSSLGEKKATFPQKLKNRDVGEWAVSLLNKTNPIPLPKATADELINPDTEMLPSTSQREVPLGRTWAEKVISYLNTTMDFSLESQSPSGGSVAISNASGEVVLKSTLSYYPLDRFSTGISLPKGLIFFPDEWSLVVFSSTKFAILASGEHASYGLPHYKPSISLTPPKGISKLTLSDDSQTVVVTGADSKQIRYDLNGNEIR